MVDDLIPDELIEAVTPENRHPDWDGKATNIQWPKGKVLARCGDVYLIQQTKTWFAVVYGLEVKQGLPLDSATGQFGSCCYHQAECLGRTK